MDRGMDKLETLSFGARQPLCILGLYKFNVPHYPLLILIFAYLFIYSLIHGVCVMCVRVCMLA